ncbi:FixH family protein [Novosphingobium colocasiae]
MSSRSGRFTGRHMATILVLGFGVVIGINFLMAHYAVSTFGGVVVENSYVASQDFNRWLDEAAKEKGAGLESAGDAPVRWQALRPHRTGPVGGNAVGRRLAPAGRRGRYGADV